jgi:hypothetical protein
LAANTLAAASSLSATSADASAANPTPVVGGASAKNALISRGLALLLNNASSARWLRRSRSGQAGLASMKARISAALP